jgi:hypothetical protein
MFATTFTKACHWSPSWTRQARCYLPTIFTQLKTVFPFTKGEGQERTEGWWARVSAPITAALMGSCGSVESPTIESHQGDFLGSLSSLFFIPWPQSVLDLITSTCIQPPSHPPRSSAHHTHSKHPTCGQISVPICRLPYLTNFSRTAMHAGRFLTVIAYK